MGSKIYISGGMSDYTEAEIKKRFSGAEDYLKFTTRFRNNPIKVYNPMRWRWFLQYIPYGYALVFDLFMLCRCDTIYMLKHWSESKGASIEHKFAKAIGIDIAYE